MAREPLRFTPPHHRLCPCESCRAQQSGAPRPRTPEDGQAVATPEDGQSRVTRDTNAVRPDRRP